MEVDHSILSTGNLAAEDRWRRAVRERERRQQQRRESTSENESNRNRCLEIVILGGSLLGALVIIAFVVAFQLRESSNGGGNAAHDSNGKMHEKRVALNPGISQRPDPDAAVGRVAAPRRKEATQIDVPAKPRKKAKQVDVPAEPSSFVTIHDSKFEVFCRPFYVSGFNAHDLVEVTMLNAERFSMKNGMSGRLRVRETLSQASAAGLNVVRIWGHTNHKKFPFQATPGVYNEAAFRGLDFVLNEARQFGMRVIVSFTDNWKYLNGADQYVDWSKTAPKRTKPVPDDNGDDPPPQPDVPTYESKRHTLFFSDPGARKLYKDHVEKILTRKNHIHGRLYKDDPTIFAWDLINEPRCRIIDNRNCTAMVQAWIKEMSEHVKKLDQNHLLTVGAEGFFGGGFEWSDANPGRWAEDVGQNFTQNHALDSIDFAAIHSWPDNWARPDLEFQEEWLKSHAEVSKNVLGKPLLLEEFGKKKLPPKLTDSKPAILKSRDPLYKETLEIVGESVENDEGIGGALFWRLSLDTYAGKRQGRYAIKMSDSTFSHIKKFSAIVQNAIHSQPPRRSCKKTECWVPHVEDNMQFCIQDTNACDLYWQVKNREKDFANTTLEEVDVPIWGGEVPLSKMKFYTSWSDCCRKGMGAFQEGCTLEYGFAGW